MLEEEIKRKRKQLNESLEKHKRYEDIYRLSVELDELIAEFYKEPKNKEEVKRKLKPRTGYRKILYIA